MPDVTMPTLTQPWIDLPLAGFASPSTRTKTLWKNTWESNMECTNDCSLNQLNNTFYTCVHDFIFNRILNTWNILKFCKLKSFLFTNLDSSFYFFAFLGILYKFWIRLLLFSGQSSSDDDLILRFETSSGAKCLVCSKVFSSIYTARRHYLYCHSDKDLSQKCRLCNTMYKNDQALGQHLRIKHGVVKRPAAVFQTNP